jgi:SAM-dependent methyltransferase
MPLTDTKNHYENHLSRYYTWMLGNFSERLSQVSRFFSEHDIAPGPCKTAIDLGAGSGLQTIPLSRAGFNVIAVDFSRSLLDEIAKEKHNGEIRIVEDDILHFISGCKEQAAVIVCMGDTITHLPSVKDVSSMIKDCARLLHKGGKLVISYRDLSGELNGESRFIPVQSDSERIFTCFLEYSPAYVTVHDIVHERTNGKWEQKVSSYKKLRIPHSSLVNRLKEEGFRIEYTNSENGLKTIIGVRE